MASATTLVDLETRLAEEAAMRIERVHRRSTRFALQMDALCVVLAGVVAWLVLRAARHAGKWRAVACPKTSYTRTKANGDLECWRLPAECPAKVGNPVNLLDGCALSLPCHQRGEMPVREQQRH